MMTLEQVLERAAVAERNAQRLASTNSQLAEEWRELAVQWLMMAQQMKDMVPK